LLTRKFTDAWIQMFQGLNCLFLSCRQLPKIVPAIS
jgi:hypothetical protein